MRDHQTQSGQALNSHVVETRSVVSSLACLKNDGVATSPLHSAALDNIARWIEHQRLTVPAILLLESCKPLHGVIDHVALCFPRELLGIPVESLGAGPSPVEQTASGTTIWRDFLAVLRNRESAEQLLKRLESGGSA